MGTASYYVSKSTTMNQFFAKTYLKMGLGLLISVAAGLALALVAPMQTLSIYSNPMIALVLGIVEIVLVLMIGRRSYSGNSSSAMMLFVLYSLINGLTFTVVFAAFSVEAILVAFGATGVTFLIMSVYGRTTKRDLSPLSNFAFGFLIGILVVSLINIFLHSTGLMWLTSIASVLIFSIYMALDTQQMKVAYTAAPDEAYLNGLSTFWALQLYMDIVNMFINLLQILALASDDN